MIVRRPPLRSLVLTGATLGVALAVAACTATNPLARIGDAGGDDQIVVVQTEPDAPQGVYYLQRQLVFVHLDPQRDADTDTQAFARTLLQRSLAGSSTPRRATSRASSRTSPSPSAGTTRGA